MPTTRLDQRYESAGHDRALCFRGSPESAEHMRAFAEKVFASDAKDEDVRDEVSMFDVVDDCPILNEEQSNHCHHDDNLEKR